MVGHEELKACTSADLAPRLQDLIHILQQNLKELKQTETQLALRNALHDHSKLPDKYITSLANKAIDLLHETEQLLEPGPLVLADLFLGFMDSKCLVAAVEFNLADILESKPLSLDRLAEACGARPDRLRQILRVLYNRGIFSFDQSSALYSNNSTSELLLKGHWTQWWRWVDMYGNEFYDMAKGIPQQCRKDETRMAGQIYYDTEKSIFQYFVDKGLLERMHNTLSSGAIAQAPGIVADYPWNEVAQARLLDVGGGQGGLLVSLLRNFPTMTGALLDIEPVIDRARRLFHGPEGEYRDVGSRIASEDLIVGDFLKDIPESEVYTMKWCLHDWDDSKALTVLTNIRKAIVRGPLSRLIIMESLLTDGRASRLTRYADITMMISANGEERDESQWTALASRTGWKLNRIHHLRNAWPCAIELVPVWTDSNSKNVMNEKEQLNINSIILQRTNGLHGQVELGCTEQGSTTSEMGFLQPWNPSKGEPFYRSACDPGYESINFEWKTHSVSIADARPRKYDFTIAENGFQYVDDPEGMPNELVDQIRKNDKKLTAQVYYPRIENLIKKHFGASRVIIFDDTVRRRDPGLDKKENPDGREQPATTVHCDQSAKGARNRLQQNLKQDEALDEILKGRVQLINVWRPLLGPVVDWPLATMDFQTLRPQHAHPVTLYRGGMTERGQTMTFEHDGEQKWYYLRHHRVDEVTLIKIWDSWGQSGGQIADCCPHAAFPHPGTPKNAAPRESIEVRCLAIFDPVSSCGRSGL